MPYNMDFPKADGSGPERYSFFSLYTVYARIFYVIFIASLALGVLAADLRLSACYVLACAAIASLLFNGLLALGYEGYLHNSQSYTQAKYTTVTIMGWVALVLFVGGVLMALSQLMAR